MTDARNSARSEGLQKRLLLNKLRLLRRGELSTDEIRSLATKFGEARIAEAIPDLKQLLDYPDDIVRYNSISSLAFEFGICNRLERLREILFDDPDEYVRGTAAAAIGSLNRGTKNPDLLTLFQRLAKDKSEHEHVRISAYDAIFNVLGVPFLEQPRDVDSPADFDWALVEKYRA